MDKMTPEYTAVHEKVKAIVKESGLSEMQKYALFTTCLTETAHEYNKTNFPMIKTKLALVCKTMLDAVEKAEQIFGKP